MNQIIYLSHLLWIRYRWTLTVSILMPVLSLLFGRLLFGSELSESQSRNLFTIYFMSALPLAGLATFAIDFANPNLSQKNSGFATWLFRYPIGSINLAAVPLACKSLLITCLFVTTLWVLPIGWKEMFLGVPVYFYWLATAFWVSALTWRNFSFAGTRAILLIVVVGSGYILSILPFVAAENWRTPLFSVCTFLSFLWLGAACIAAYYWLVQARTNEHSSILERCMRPFLSITRTSSSAYRQLDAMMSMSDSQKSIDAHIDTLTHSRTIASYAALPIVLLMALTIGYAIPSILLVCIGVYLVFLSSNSATRESPWREHRRLSSLIAVAPLSEIRIAAVRIFSNLKLSLALLFVYTASLVSIAVLYRVQWQESHALPLYAALALFGGCLAVTRGFAWMWLDSLHRRSISAVSAVGTGLLMLGMIVSIVVFFLWFETWEELQLAVRRMLETLPAVLLFALGCKLVAAMLATRMHLVLFRNDSRRVGWLLYCVSGWSITVACVSVGIYALLQQSMVHDAFTPFGIELLMWVAAPITVACSVGLSIPLTRLIALPTAIWHDLHR